MLSSTASGILLCDNSKKRIAICKELSALCDMFLMDLSYKITPVKELLENALCKDNIMHLDFISYDNITQQKEVKSLLSKEENNEISLFLFSLGKSDVNSQKKLISSFKEYINGVMESYSEKHKRNSKLYVTFGFFFGAVICLIWS